MKKLLIVFIKNAALGKVKTRLAATVGDVRALAVYKTLLSHTLSVSKGLDCDKIVFYSDFIPAADEWQAAGFSQALQSSGDLGKKMSDAFGEGFSQSFSSIVIIGSDCHELTSEHIRDAFSALESSEVVIGPAYDGGYYLLGMNKFYDQLFVNKAWSSASVLSDTMRDIGDLNLKSFMLTKLHDIDNEEDLVRSSIKLT